MAWAAAARISESNLRDTAPLIFIRFPRSLLARPGQTPYINDMRSNLLAFVFVMTLVAAADTAYGQLVPGSIGNGGSMPDTMSPGALLPPPVAPPAPVMAPPPPQPNTYSLQRDQLQNQGYRIQRLEQRNDGSWRANVTRDPVPTRPQGVPKKVTILPNGQIIEEY